MGIVTLNAANGRSLRLERPQQPERFTAFGASLSIPSGRAQVDVGAHGVGPHDEVHWLADYFLDLASSWRGWKGAKNYETPARDFLLSATHDGLGTVTIRVTLCQPWDPGYWSFNADLDFGGGAELERIARDIRDL